MTMPNAPTDEFMDLMYELAEDRITPERHARLEELLWATPDNRQHYVDFMLLVAGLHQTRGEGKVASDEGGRVQGAENVDGGQWSVAGEINPKSSLSTNHYPLSTTSSPLPTIILDSSSPLVPQPANFYVAHPFLFSNLFALLVMGLGVLGAWVYQIDIPRPVAQVKRSAASADKLATADRLKFVGRVTGMVNVLWSDINTSTEISNGVPLGRRYELVSGLMEITYDTGAKVTLQGPCTYHVDSRDGGFLSIGKLTARLEKRGERREKREEGTANQKSSLSTIHYPLFTIKTPTATVTDLGTEFAVEVKPDKATLIHVIRGVVEAQRDSRTGGTPIRERLVAGEAICISSLTDSPQRLNGSSLHTYFAPDLKAAVRQARQASEARRLLTPMGLVASAYHRVWDGDGKFLAENDRQKAFLVATDDKFGRGEKNEGPRSSFDTSAKRLGIRDGGLEGVGGRLSETANQKSSLSNIHHPLSTSFVGLRYDRPQQFDRIKVFLGRQTGDGGSWAEMPRVFILKNPVDTDRTPPEQDTANWTELPMRPLFGAAFTPTPDKNPGEVIELPLTGFSAEDRTGYGWAIGGVQGDGAAGYVSITELRAYTSLSPGDDAAKGGNAGKQKAEHGKQ